MGKKQCLTEDIKWDYLLVAPTIIGLIVLDVYSFLQTLALSSSTTHPFGYYGVNGVENYVQISGSKEFWKVTQNSIYFCILTVPLGMFLSLLTAVLLSTKIQARAVFRAIHFLPMMVVPAAIATVRKWIFSAECGIINQVIGNRVNWLTSPELVFLTCAVTAVWSTVGYDAVLLLSEIQNILKSYYEAASLDGASKVEQSFKIILPTVSPTLFVVLIMRLMVSLKVYGPIYTMMNQMNPALTSAQSLMYLSYRESFVARNREYASAIVMWTVPPIGAAIALQFWGQNKWVNHEIQGGGKL